MRHNGMNYPAVISDFGPSGEKITPDALAERRRIEAARDASKPPGRTYGFDRSNRCPECGALRPGCEIARLTAKKTPAIYCECGWLLATGNRV